MTGIEALLELLAQAGVTHLFGNPGTTELPLNEALTRDARFRYIFGIHEIPVLAMADGYAQASGTVSVCNLHIACGLGNAMGMLYNAHRAGTPILVTAGQQDRRLRFFDPVLSGDLVRVAQPWTKWTCEVQRVEEIPHAVRRALQIARTPPTGPVFLALPLDVQMETYVGTLPGLGELDVRTRPPRVALEKAAALLAQATHPAILAGSRVVAAGALDELRQLAERFAAPVYAENTTSHGRLPMAADHPLYQGTLPLWSGEIAAILRPFDVILAVGLTAVRLYIYQDPASIFPERTRWIHLDDVPEDIGKNHPADVGLLGDIREGLAELLAFSPQTDVSERLAERKQAADAKRSALWLEMDAVPTTMPLAPEVLMTTLARVLPAHAVVVEEAITTHRNLLERLGFFRDPTGHFAHRGWALGWGLGCALGVKLAWPERPVVALLGDGSALYGIQGLWTAAHHRIPVLFVIAHNAQYQILKICGDVMNLPRLRDPACPGMELRDPVVDFVSLAQSMGVSAARIASSADLAERVAAWLRRPTPMLLEVPLSE